MREQRYEKKSTLSDYIDDKVTMLTDEFYLRLTMQEYSHFYSLKTEAAVDQYAIQLIMDKL